MTDNNYKAHLALLGANIIYGANFLIAKGLMPDKIGASALVLLRIIVAGILFWIVKQFVKEKVKKKDIVLLAFCGLFGISTNMLLFFHGLSLTSPIDASIIMTATPVIVLILSAFILKEKITKNKYIGILIGAIGAVILIVYGKNAVGTSSFLGNLFVFLNACSYGLYLVLVKPLMKKYKAITVISWVFLFGLIFVFPFGINDLLATNFNGFTTNTYLAIAFVIIGTTFFTYLFNIYALNYVPPSVNGSYIYLQPVLSFILVSLYAYVFGNDEYAQDINLVKIASCILVVFGVYMISKKPKLA
ncbi:DMT family transporter [Lutibacter maritimus]|uniref:Permease of the drug/metabolite transporter (DMT) superfamily n=1 Tax=Lutibacter maritimus TaxID=593133 RepID=A0A1I6RHX5_9FLAO|nr:DMT family transporter [Lutibacter maritimus]SFS64266.1 Permease of the drug/metabolite transporter (DMT) superfamily [Lutibacter maritimus]